MRRFPEPAKNTEPAKRAVGSAGGSVGVSDGALDGIPFCPSFTDA